MAVKVKAQLRCGRCGETPGLCAPVRVAAPPSVRCDHPTHTSADHDAAGEIVCPICSVPWRLSDDLLTVLLEEEIYRNADRCQRNGVVEVRCGY
ncbi:hypothetical protein IDH50_11125 [Aeromicrobium tamlense]|uniref:Uncharacterized protein n=1 Tax=Aeromicrobium tamlense TaxID=375541 RepID=A0A8I0KIK0_9ACTN|nr:hypothetical protein [Aeromicrobium tamlense]MBD1270785.1 hypothetical protein [Aeromicrobium tamlense]NYI38177.1 hypothetical protein [Aeromicrobium tamlense]